MGFMTEISILNDQWSTIAKNPQRLVDDISAHMHETTDSAVGQTTIIRSHHADDMKVYVSYQNSFREAWPDHNLDARRLEYHLEDLSKMYSYIKMCRLETDRRLKNALQQTK